MRPLEPDLRQGITALGLALEDSQISQLLDYLALIEKWTKVYNLTSVRDPAEMLTHHVLDSLAVIAPLRKKLTLSGAVESVQAVKLLDVGSGAGLPGIVIAICCPDIRVDCVDTVAKKIAFIRQVAATLRLLNLQGLHARVESLHQKYDVVSSRAFASLVDFTAWSKAALGEQGIWLAMKGKDPTDEMGGLPPDVSVFHVEQLAVPGLDADRCIVWMRQASV